MVNIVKILNLVRKQIRIYIVLSLESILTIIIVSEISCAELVNNNLRELNFISNLSDVF